MIFVKGERHHVSQTTTLGAPPPLILGFHPSKRHDTLLLFYLVDLICYGLFLYLRIGVISASLGLANGLDDPATY